jgi:hypothetical protein
MTKDVMVSPSTAAHSAALRTGGVEPQPEPDRVALEAALFDDGFAIVPQLAEAKTCEELIAAYADDERYRSTIVMERHNFGRGEYRYYRYPLPEAVATLRAALYRVLAPMANRWNEALRLDERYPADLEAYLTSCAEAGQHRPTPLILRYGAGDFNALHQDLYGERAFPFQTTVYLSEHSDYEGGETVLTFGRPRAQTVARSLSFERGDALILTNRYRPVSGTRGTYRENVRHGVSLVRSGERYALGLIFHDAT